jgi:glutamate synthase domain-containing protein 2/glutamate synthase domain-containing protein 1/glutamate synthase domain-containing protein 3
MKESSACGLATLVDRKGLSTHKLIQDGIRMISCNAHRSGTGADLETSDGVGASYQMPTNILNRDLGLSLIDGEFGLIHLYLSTKDSPKYEQQKKRLKEIFESDAYGLKILGERTVDVNADVLGPMGRESLPHMEDIVFAKPEGMSPSAFRKRIYEAATQLDATLRQDGMNYDDFSITSASDSYILRKSLALPERFGDFYKEFSDPELTSNFWVSHTRFSTGTKTRPASVQPFGSGGQFVWAHNGEFVSAPANVAFYQSIMQDNGNPTIFPYGLSDTAQFATAGAYVSHMDEASLAEVLFRMVPPAEPTIAQISDPELKAKVTAAKEFYRLSFQSWNGPAALIGFDAENDMIVAHQDALGTRPLAYTMTEDSIYLGSETGLLNATHGQIQENAGVTSGAFVAIDRKTGELLSNEQVLKHIIERGEKRLGKTFQQALEEKRQVVKTPDHVTVADTASTAALSATKRAIMYGWDAESANYFVNHAARTGKTRIISMGYDVATPALREDPVTMEEMVKLRFAQVTRPPTDDKRQRSFMNAGTDLGARPTVRADSKQITVESAILWPGMLEEIEKRANATDGMGYGTYAFVAKKSETMQDAMNAIADKVVKDIRENGMTIATLTDKGIDAEHHAIPPEIAVAHIRRRLWDEGLVNQCSIICESGQVYEPTRAQSLRRLGASLVAPHLAEDFLREEYARNPQQFGGVGLEQAVNNYYHEMDDAAMKVLGINGSYDQDSDIGSRQIEFEELDLDPKREPYLDYLFGAQQVKTASGEKGPTVIGGIFTPHGGVGMAKLEDSYARFHDLGLRADALPHKGRFEAKGVDPFTGEKGVRHHYTPPMVEAFAKMRAAWRQQEYIARNTDKPWTETGDFNDMMRQGFRTQDEKRVFEPTEIDTYKGSSGPFRKYTEVVNAERTQQPTSIAHLLSVGNYRDPETGKERGSIPLDEVEPLSNIVRRFAGADMSVQALTGANMSKTGMDLEGKAHEAITEGLQILGAIAGSGEGGISLGRVIDGLSSPKRMQWGSAQFGINPDMFVDALKQILKMGQGAKPGTGGEAPAAKVVEEVAFLRNVLPYVDLPSPYVHQDIASIEDLIVKFLLMSASDADVIGKVVHTGEDFPPVVSGVAKAMLYAGINQDGQTGGLSIARGDGGTAASPTVSSSRTSLSGPDGIVVAHDTLAKNGLRPLTPLSYSGGMQTADDVMLAAALGADSFEFGTLLMMCVGCVLIKRCSEPGGCIPGVANNPDGFKGEAMDVSRFIIDMAANLREQMAAKGFKSMGELVARRDCIQVQPLPKALQEHVHFDFSSFTQSPDVVPLRAGVKEKLQELKPFPIDDKIIPEIEKVLRGEKPSFVMTEQLPVQNSNIAIGAKTSMAISRHRIGLLREAYSDLEAAEKTLDTLHKTHPVQIRYNKLMEEREAQIQHEFERKWPFQVLGSKAPDAMSEQKKWMEEQQVQARRDIAEIVISEGKKTEGKIIDAFDDAEAHLIDAEKRFSKALGTFNEDTFIIKLKGVASLAPEAANSFGGAGAALGGLIGNGITIELEGQAADSAGENMTKNAVLVIKQPADRAEDKDIRTAGKALGLAATGGKIFNHGIAGNLAGASGRGVTIVTEGVGDQAMAFSGPMTMLNIKPIFGRSHGEGANGGVMLQYDPAGNFASSCDKKTMEVKKLLDNPEMEEVILGLLKEHHARTGSTEAKRQLDNWPEEKQHYSVAIAIAQSKHQNLEAVVDVTGRRMLRDDGNMDAGTKAWANAEMGRRGWGSQEVAGTGLTKSEAHRL